MIKNYLRTIYISKQVSHLVNFLSYPWKGKAAILMYHRVLPDEKIKEDLDLGLAVSCSNFEKQIKTLKSKYKIVSIDELINNLREGINKFMIAITFDDGYKDNLSCALPILEKYQVPASIYVTTSFLEKNVCIWWYELKGTIQNKSLLNFVYEKQNFNFELKNHKQKFLAFNVLRKLFLNLKPDKQIELLEQITETKTRKNYSEICLNPDEVKILDNSSLITIGSHSHNHLNLKILSNDEILYEVKKSLGILENLLGHKVKHFSYPYGEKNQNSSQKYNIIENLSFDSAVTAKAYPIKNYNLFSLPRIYVGQNTCEKAIINHLSGFYNLTNKFF